MGATTSPKDEMANAVSIEHFDLPGRIQEHEDLKTDDDFDDSFKQTEDFEDKIIIDKDHLMRRYAIQIGEKYDSDEDKRKVREAFYKAPTMGYTVNTSKYLDKYTDSGFGQDPDAPAPEEDMDGLDMEFEAARSRYPGSFYLWLGKEDFKGRDGGADALIERYLSLDLTWEFLDADDARSFRESETLAKFSNVRPKELSDINDMWDDNWDDVYSQFGKTNPMHRKLMAQSIAELNPQYEPFKPYLKYLDEVVKPRWKGDGCDVVNWVDNDVSDENWDQENRFQVIRKYNPGRTPVLPVTSPDTQWTLTNLEPLVNTFAWDLWDARREEIMDQIELRDTPVPMMSEIVNG